MTMFNAINIWKRIGCNRVACYRCFQIVDTGRYCVQSCDFYDVPLRAEEATRLTAQFIELLAESAPDLRSGSFESIAEAIANHDREFS